jgi:MoaA/NifB/PqqE/SkfB family radical SAM enzyme
MTGFWRHAITEAWRRDGWVFERPTFRKWANICLAAFEFTAKRERMWAWPIVVKIDISPLCNLRCTVCVHAKPDGVDYLEKQHFHSGQKMSVDSYRNIIDQIRGKSSAVSLYYLGDPLVHPDLDEMCRIAYDAGLNVHISTNFSFKLTDERIHNLLTNGVTHLTVCVDGLRQEKYELTRVGGHIEWVIANLKRMCALKRELKLRFPRIEVQYISFEHNLPELEDARRMFEDLNVDQFSVLEGSTDNWASRVPERYDVIGAKAKTFLPQCLWPHYFMVIKYNGEVIPCCSHRLDVQYSRTDDSHAVGDVSRTPLREIWNSPPYRQMRRLVSNPEKVATEPGSADSFCYGCGKVYHIHERAAKPEMAVK